MRSEGGTLLGGLQWVRRKSKQLSDRRGRADRAPGRVGLGWQPRDTNAWVANSVHKQGGFHFRVSGCLCVYPRSIPTMTRPGNGMHHECNQQRGNRRPTFLRYMHASPTSCVLWKRATTLSLYCPRPNPTFGLPSPFQKSVNRYPGIPCNSAAEPQTWTARYREQQRMRSRWIDCLT